MSDLAATYAALVEVARPRLLAFISRRLSDHAVAEELTQDVLLRGWKAWSQFEGLYPIPWLYRIAGNVLIDYYRHHGLLQILSLDEPCEDGESWYKQSEDLVAAWSGGAQDPAAAALAAEERSVLGSLVASLPAGQRVVVQLRLEQPLRSWQMGVKLGSTAKAVRSRYWRAVRKLQVSAVMCGYWSERACRQVQV